MTRAALAEATAALKAKDDAHVRSVASLLAANEKERWREAEALDALEAAAAAEQAAATEIILKAELAAADDRR